ncbi:hypothetical protein GGQ97_001868 [Sphingomonas kaistensis]|uniref:Uncharacterized protein n=1 Tax=Sphingomonas kaistensis TaxID=298708 RepID=A0A7X5Y780_9SPHN|nr:hypothetical protein [Sphingomonas kaistensis]NJC06075.1 hypothetical protein [Sphingomonas kaistensis]
MAWNIARSEALADPDAARRKVLGRLQRLSELEDAELQVVNILIDAVLMAEAYRGARHQVTFLPEMTRSVDHLLRDLAILDKADELASA